MRIKAKIISIIMIVATNGATSHPAHAKAAPEYTTVVVDYIGRTDRPVFPIVVSSSMEEGEWYRNKLFGTLVNEFIPVNVVQKMTLNEVATMLAPKAIPSRLPFSTKPISQAAIRIVVGKGHRFEETRLNLEDGIIRLDALKEHKSVSPSLASQISHFEDRMKQYSEAAQH